MQFIQEPLVVVDAQDVFIHDRAWRNIISLVEKAKKQRRHIFLVEFFRNGPTKRSIMKSLYGYPKWHRSIKTQYDGSKEIMSFMNHLEVSCRSFAVCGYLLNCCVRATACGLLLCETHHEFVRIHADACNREDKFLLHHHHEKSLDTQETKRGIVISRKSKAQLVA